MDKVFTFLPLLFGKDNIVKDEENRVFSIVRKTIKSNLFRDFISYELIVCYHNNKMVERSNQILKSPRIDSLILENDHVYVNNHIRNICYKTHLSLGTFFSKETIFTGHLIGQNYVTSISGLGVTLENEWKRVSGNILTKYKLFKCVMEKDVVLRIIEILCLLGNYTF